MPMAARRASDVPSRATCLAWHLWLPGLAIAGLFHLTAGWTLVAVTACFALLLTPALLDPQRRLLHDRWTGTRVVRVPA